MRIAFFHQPNDPYTITRIKYFISKGHKVFSIVFYNNVKQKEISDLTIIELPSLFVNKILKRFLYKNNIRSITKELNIDILYIVSALNSYYLKYSEAKRTLLELEGSEVIININQYGFLRKFYKKYWVYADAIIQDSKIAKESAQKFFPKNIINKTINIGVDFNIFNPKIRKNIVRDKYNLNNRFIIFHSRSLKKIYNVEIIIKSIVQIRNKIPNICLILTGDKTSISNELIDFIDNNSLDENIFFTGYLDHDSEIKYYYADADLCVSIPSSDSSPFSVYEAMATKTPVLVSDLPWIQENFKNTNLIILKNLDSLSLADLIIKFYNGNVVADTESSYNIVFQKINKHKENNKLEILFNQLIDV